MTQNHEETTLQNELLRLLSLTPEELELFRDLSWHQVKEVVTKTFPSELTARTITLSICILFKIKTPLDDAFFTPITVLIDNEDDPTENIYLSRPRPVFSSTTGGRPTFGQGEPIHSDSKMFPDPY